MTSASDDEKCYTPEYVRNEANIVILPTISKELHMALTYLRRQQTKWLRGRAGAGRKAAAVAAGVALVLVAAIAAPPATVFVEHEAHFAGVAPDRLAHVLADFSVHARLDPNMGEWTVLQESGNGTAWRYDVAYACGDDCAGRARVHAVQTPHAHAHRVLVAHRTCRHAWLLPSTLRCDEWASETTVRGSDGGVGGALLKQRLSAACGWASALSGACAARLQRRQRLNVAALRALFAASSRR